MFNSTATPSVLTKLKAALPKSALAKSALSKTGNIFKTTCTANGHDAKPAMAQRQARVQAIWINAMLWTFQGWLAMFYAGASFAKLTAPSSHLAILLGWSQYVPQPLVVAVGVIEAALALGMLAPIAGWAIGRPVLTYSALGLLAIQTAATLYHLVSFDIGAVLLNIALIAMTLSILMFKCARHTPAN